MFLMENTSNPHTAKLILAYCGASTFGVHSKTMKTVIELNSVNHRLVYIQPFNYVRSFMYPAFTQR